MYKSLLIYPSFIVTCILLAGIFITATTYTQLGIAIVLYPLLAVFAYKVFTRRKSHRSAVQEPTVTVKPQVATEKVKTQPKIVVDDIDKRTFLKLMGATGISFFLLSIFGRRVESLMFGGQNLTQTPAFTGNSEVDKPNPTASPTDGYNISEIDDNIISYYGFIKGDDSWFIMRGDTNTGSFRYIKGKSDLPANWQNRENLKYDYFSKVFSSN